MNGGFSERDIVFVNSNSITKFEIWFDIFHERFRFLFLFFFPPPNCFRTVFVPTSFANVLKFLRPLTTSQISGAASSNKSAPILFASWTICFLKKGMAVLQRVYARAPQLLPRCLVYLEKKKGKNQLYFQQPFRMKFKSKVIIRKFAEQDNNSSISYEDKRNCFGGTISQFYLDIM